MVFPSIRHTRFEHSLGTYYIASKIFDKIDKNKIESDNNFDDNIKKLPL
ncbi:hypothetical protein AB1303_00860 [Saccharolobus solfataricus]|nr:hypothetical protein [Saccharolobus solfataricus]QPG48878.1 hypothetical protein HFC64_02005 [Saccharolobus solfataricus]